MQLQPGRVKLWDDEEGKRGGGEEAAPTRQPMSRAKAPQTPPVHLRCQGHPIPVGRVADTGSQANWRRWLVLPGGRCGSLLDRGVAGHWGGFLLNPR